MRNRLLLSYGVLVLVILVVLGVPLGATFARGERRDLTQRVQHDALSLALLSARQLEERDYDTLRSLAAGYTERTGARVVITDELGLSVADSDDASRPLGRDFSTRPEIAAALRGEESVGIRTSETLNSQLLYVAEPVETGGRLHGTVRVTYPTSFVQSRIRRLWALLAGIGAVNVLIGLVVSFFVAWAVVAGFLAYLKKRGLIPFGVYRIIVGAIVFLFLVGG